MPSALSLDRWKIQELMEIWKYSRMAGWNYVHSTYEIMATCAQGTNSTRLSCQSDHVLSGMFAEQPRWNSVLATAVTDLSDGADKFVPSSSGWVESGRVWSVNCTIRPYEIDPVPHLANLLTSRSFGAPRYCALIEIWLYFSKTKATSPTNESFSSTPNEATGLSCWATSLWRHTLHRYMWATSSAL